MKAYSIIINEIWILLKQYKAHPLFWLWIILFFTIYKKTYIIVVLMSYVWLRIGQAVVLKHICITDSILDRITWKMLKNAETLKSGNFINWIIIICSNFILTFSIGSLRLWLILWDTGLKNWTRAKMYKKKNYYTFVKKTLALFKAKELKMDTKILQIKKIKIHYKL